MYLNFQTLYTALTPISQGSALPIPKYATGGIVTRSTLAMIGENPGSRGEAVIPLEKLDSMLAGGGFSGAGGSIGSLQIIMPNVKDVRDMSENDWMTALKKARNAAARLGQNGYSWRMA